MNIEQTNAFAETLFIINCLPKNDQNKISKSFINFLKENKNNDYVVKINPDISLQNQELLEDTKALLKEIYMSFFISDEERDRIVQYDKYRELVEEDIKAKKYNEKNIFNTVSSNTSISIEEDKAVSIVEKNDSFFKRILRRIKAMIKKEWL